MRVRRTGKTSRKKCKSVLGKQKCSWTSECFFKNKLWETSSKCPASFPTALEQEGKWLITASFKGMTDECICWRLSTSSWCWEQNKAVPRMPKLPYCIPKTSQELICPQPLKSRVCFLFFFIFYTLYTDGMINPTFSFSYIIFSLK